VTADAAPRPSPLAALPGLLFVVLLSWAAIAAADAPWVRARLHVSPLLLVIVFGMLWRSTLPLPGVLAPGLRVAQRGVLRWGVAALGFRLGFGELIGIGAPALAVVTISTFVALVFGWWIAERLRVGHKLGLLLGVGGAICGASAIVAADTVVQSDHRDVPIALGVVTLLGTIGIFVYPLLRHPLGIGDFAFGVWDGASLHETAQVVAAGFAVSEEAGRVATVVKLARIALLAPVVLYLGWTMRRHHEAAGRAHVAPVPWFLALFVLFAIVNSSGWLPAAWIERIRHLDVWILCAGMAGVGLQTGFRDLREAGLRPIAAGAAQWVVLSVVAYGLARTFVG